MESLLAVFAAMAKPVLFCLLGLSAAVGLIALVSPRAFAVCVEKGNHWVDTWRFFRVPEGSILRKMDRWIDVDGCAVQHSRAAGACILLATLIVGMLWILAF